MLNRLLRSIPVRFLTAMAVIATTLVPAAGAWAESSGAPAAETGATDIVLIGEDAAVVPLLDAYAAIRNGPDGAGLARVGFADGPRGRLFGLFCHPPAGVPKPDMMALAGRMTPEEFSACEGQGLIELPVSGLASPGGAVELLTVYVRRDRAEANPHVAALASLLLQAPTAGIAGFLHKAGLPRLREDARLQFETRLGNRALVTRESLAASLDVLAAPRPQKGENTPPEAASTRLMITGVGQGARMTVAEARAFAEARGYEAPEVFYRFGAPAIEIFCTGQNTALPDILVLDWRMSADHYAACQKNGFLWMTELFLGHAPPRSGSGDYRPVFLYVKKGHADALPVVREFLEHLVSEAVIGEGGRFETQGFTPIAPARRLGLAAQINEMPPIISSAAFETPVPAPWQPTKAPEWASGRVIDGPRYALVIGNSAYSAGMGPLSNPVKDANAMRAALESVGFEVMLHTDLDQKGMRRAIRDFSRALSDAPANATALFYFSGHGMQTDGLNYLAPVDAEIAEESDIEIEAVSANAILAQIEDAGLALNLLFLDACRNNTFERRTKSATRGLAPIKAENNTLIVYATRPGAVAYDGEGRTSPFTGALVDAIAAPGVPVEFAMKDVARRVRAETEEKQSPWIEGVLLNNFYFSPPR